MSLSRAADDDTSMSHSTNGTRAARGLIARGKTSAASNAGSFAHKQHAEPGTSLTPEPLDHAGPGGGHGGALGGGPGAVDAAEPYVPVPGTFYVEISHCPQVWNNDTQDWEELPEGQHVASIVVGPYATEAEAAEACKDDPDIDAYCCDTKNPRFVDDVVVIGAASVAPDVEHWPRELADNDQEPYGSPDNTAGAGAATSRPRPRAAHDRPGPQPRSSAAGADMTQSPTTPWDPPTVPCEECEWEAVRMADGTLIRWRLHEPCGEHYDAARHAHLHA